MRPGHTTSIDIIKTIACHGFWFVDVPRTGSSSIRCELFNDFGPIHGKKNLLPESQDFASDQVFPDHQTAQQMRSLLGKELWSSLYTFAFVRNPYARVYSMFCYQRKARYIPRTLSFHEFVSNLAKGTYTYQGVSLGAHGFITDTHGQKIVTEVFRYEDRTGALATIGRKLGMTFQNLHVQKATPKGSSYMDEYNQQGLAAIRHLYAEDFKLGNYQLR